MKIEVTQEMINRFWLLKKTYPRRNCCPITQAIMKSLKTRKFHRVATDFLGVEIDGITKFRITKKMEKFMQDFDLHQIAKPTTFQLRKIK